MHVKSTLKDPESGEAKEAEQRQSDRHNSPLQDSLIVNECVVLAWKFAVDLSIVKLSHFSKLFKKLAESTVRYVFMGRSGYDPGSCYVHYWISTFFHTKLCTYFFRSGKKNSTGTRKWIKKFYFFRLSKLRGVLICVLYVRLVRTHPSPVVRY